MAGGAANYPEIKPWRLGNIDDYGNRYYTRNPYYFKVDTQGQQLPYLDRQGSGVPAVGSRWRTY